MSKDNVKLAYAIAHSSSSKGYFGAILITDYKGFPLEFRYTDPIVPTKIQQVLYGEGLEKYLKIDVITDSIVKSLSEDISVLFVEDEDLLEYKDTKFPIVRLSATQAAPVIEPGSFQLVKTNEILLQTSHAKSPVRLLFQEEFDCSGEVFDSIISQLTKAGEFMDVEEPLKRVLKTMDLVANEEV